jgi:hypothetical protein
MRLFGGPGFVINFNAHYFPPHKPASRLLHWANKDDSLAQTIWRIKNAHYMTRLWVDIN